MPDYKEFLYNEEKAGYTAYLKKIKFEDKLCRLSKKFKNKKILIYGNGILFDVITEKYELSKYLNICAVSDLRYEKENTSEYKGFKAVKPSKIKDVNADVIFVTTINPLGIKDFLLKNNFADKKTIIKSIFEHSANDKIRSMLKRVYSAFCYLCNTGNIVNSVKYCFVLSETEYESKNNYVKKIKELKKNKQKKIKVAFVCEENPKWGYQSLYDELKNDNNFEVLPIVNYPIITKERQEFLQKENIGFFESFGMEAIDGYDYEKNIFKPLKDFEPDIVFYQQPWYLKYSQLPQEVSKYALTCIISYGFTSIDAKSWGSDAVRKFSGHLWKMFAESEYHNKFYKQSAKLNHKDILITKGYPKLDDYKKPINEQFEKLWKDCEKEKKHRIIWAPHHSIDNYGLAMSFFKEQYKYFIELAKKHPEYSFVVKPHPMLRFKCASEKFLTEEEYDGYMSEWNSLPNASVYTGGNYFDIFKSSDVLITDSSSFLAEYFYSGKPVIFFGSPNRAGFNDFGLKIKKGFYIPEKTEDVEDLLTKLLIDKEDYLKTIRERIIKKEFYYPKNGAGKNITEYIKKQINR